MDMKKRPPKAEAKSRKRMYVGLLGLLIIAIMVGSALQWGREEDEGAVEYKGLKFAQTNAGWVAFKPDNSQLLLLTSPAELQNMTIPYLGVQKLNTYSKIYVTYNPKERVRAALNQFFKNVPITPLVVPACTVDIELCAESPLKNCTDAGEGIGIIQFEESNETEVSFINDCLLIKGKELIKLVDKIILEEIA